jgi:hypothetical protein
MSFLVANIAGCVQTGTLFFVQGPYCSVEHASAPLHTEKHSPEITLSQELTAILLATTILFTFFSKRILEKTLVRFLGLTGRIGRMEHIRSRTGPIPFDLFLPQMASAHGM